MVWVWCPPHPMNQKGHHRSYTCVKSRAQAITEQQMLHLHDGSRTAPDELEFTSEPQQQISSHRQRREAGIKTPLPQPRSQHQVLPPRAAFSTDHPHHFGTPTPGTSEPPSETSPPLKKGHSYFKSNQGGIGGSCQPAPPDLPSHRLPTTVRRQKPHQRKTAAAETVPLG